ncbi:anion exchange protein 2 isoform X3 [Aplysia californica]|uniref:Anion exchange protein n=1 Tax=Aplysia californica TaxID=6500 RepID=A0ABM1VPK4_APLCA|nr:anion exchange protein 2 isoform X3 [Aplysia californica]
MAAHHGRDRSSRRGEEHIPLTSDQDEMSTAPGGLSSTSLSASCAGMEEPVVEGFTSSQGIRAINTEPVLSRDSLADLADPNVTRLSFLDEVDKIFDRNWPCEASSLTTDPNCHAPTATSMGRESSKLALSEFYQVDEAEYSRHRRVSYPHIHQPLRSLSSKSLTKAAKAHKAKKKHKKKKKKEKLRSFPSRNAIQSPPIPEEEEEGHHEDQENYSSSSESEDDDDDDDAEAEESQDLKIDETTALLKSKDDEMTNSHSALPGMQLIPATPSPEHKASTARPFDGAGTTTNDGSSLEAEEQPRRPSVLGNETVGFYIGNDFPSPSREPSVDQFSRTFQISPRDTPSPDVDHTDQLRSPAFGEGETTPAAVLGISDEEPIPSHRPDYLRVTGPEFDGSTNVSPMPSHPPSRKHSTAGKVTFVVGDDPSYHNFQTQLSDGISQAIEDRQGSFVGKSEEKESNWKAVDENEVEGGQRRKSRRGSGRRRGSSDSESSDASDQHQLLRVPSEEGSQSTRSSIKRRHHHHHEHFAQSDLVMRRQKGSEVQLNEKYQKSPTETEEASILNKADLDDMTSHRFEDQRGIRRHKITRSKGTIVHMGKSHHEKKPRVTKKYDHSPHEMFVELDELHFGGDDMWEWREKARWIKFEEDVEEGAERWGKPHVASLSFHSLLELRRGLENGSLLLDLEATDLNSIIHNVVENLVIRDLVEESVKGKLLQTLLLKHRHVSGRSAFLRRNSSYSNLVSLDASKRHQQEKGLMKTLSQSSMSSLGMSKNPSQSSLGLKKGKENNSNSKAPAKLEMVKVDVDNNMPASGDHTNGEPTYGEPANGEPTNGEPAHPPFVVATTTVEHSNLTDKLSDGIHIGLTPVEQKKHVQDIMRRIPKGSEASTVLVGQVSFLTKPAMAFVRLAEGQVLENLTEVPLPVRFLFVLLGPSEGGMDYHEVGRSLSTLMSNQQFHNVAYRAETREDLLRAINSFLEDSIVLPPGDWDHRTLLPITHMARKRAQLRHQKKQQSEEKEGMAEVPTMLSDKDKEKEEPPHDPLQRTGCLFGGVINDVRRRYPHYVSDIKDAANKQSIAALFFIFFTCLSPCIAFGGLLSEKTHSLMGVSETMIATSVFGMMFSLLCGQPLLILGATGPVLVFEESLYKFCVSNGLEFLPVRFWVGFWVFLITTLAVALEGSFLVRYVTRFTEEIFAILISLIFIYEVVKKLMQIFATHPLKEDYCDIGNLTGLGSDNDTHPYSVGNGSDWLAHLAGNSSDWLAEDTTANGTSVFGHLSDHSAEHEAEIKNQPNTALMSLILTLGTFLIAYFLRVFRNSKFFGRSVRRALGDFGVLIALLSMTLLGLLMNETYVQKLDITDPLTPTSSSRPWFINPTGIHSSTPVWIAFAAILPGFLIFILLFMETQITEMILNKKERKLQKGSGYHVDQLLLGFLTFVGGLFGLPWMCAATVRTVAHVSALSEYSRTHAPGEKPQLLGVKEQRVTNFAVHLLIGLSAGLGPVLRAIPVPALFGVFLYLGVSAMSGVQMFERIKLLLMPVKYHPSVSYVRKVRTMAMHKFTLIQLGCLVFLLIIKSTQAALAFPFMLILLVPLRMKAVVRFFSKEELEELDKEEEAFDLDEEDDPDFYQQAHMPI